ncbi:Hypothetical predicted protein [Mytilus galloprovincialis]|uniref:TRPM-like domain-containing protein n=1 Tax=Mytilus galloprovincialis TaxID=29158 RepID=A0A8B6DM83_MYTGA|nr:Hypothetical predicted protein [Mytilus galloprovincialis]
MTKVKRKLPVMFAKRFKNDMFEKIEEILNRIVKRDWMISIFNIKKHNPEELWEKLSDGIMRAWSFEEIKGLCFSKLGLVTCCRISKQSDESTSSDVPYVESLRVAIMGNNVQLAAQIWSNCENPMMTALVSNIYLTAMADKADQLFEETLQADILSHSRKFSSRAVKLLDKLFSLDENMATKALDHVSEVWDHKESPLHFGHQFNMEEFISHPSAQKDASKRMYPYANEEDTTSNILTKENTKKDSKSRECLPFIKVIHCNTHTHTHTQPKQSCIMKSKIINSHLVFTPAMSMSS